jgi:hypothetical protein
MITTHLGSSEVSSKQTIDFKSPISIVPQNPNLIVNSDPKGINFWDLRARKKCFHIRDLNPFNQGLDCQELLMTITDPLIPNSLQL